MDSKRRQTDNEDKELTALVRSAQRGNQEAFGQLVNRYQRAIHAIVFARLHNDAEAQEVCQEVFMQAMRKIDQLQEPRAFGGWLRTIAVRMSINRAVRRAQATPTDSAVLESTCVDSHTPLTEALAKEKRKQVHQGLGRLRSLDRDTLVAFYFKGQSLIEMSDDFSSPVGTIKRRLHVARQRLAAELESLAPA